MKKLIPIIILTLCSCAKAPDYSRLTSENHPRLFADDREFASVRKAVEKGDNEILNLLHGAVMELAETHALSPETLEYKKDASGKRLLAVSREAITRIFTASYAYRFTGDERYLHHAENDLNTVCNFPDWNPSHYLDCAEMATAVAIGYDWLYNKLQDSTKAKVVEAINKFAFETSLIPQYTWWYEQSTNWNQVCNAGLTCAALSTWESDPEVAKAIVDKSIASNTPVVGDIYRPIGAYPEGPVYWNYGTMFQTLLCAELESTLGTDFGIGEGEGFNKTGRAQCYMAGNTEKWFNYYDNCPPLIPSYPLWYLADRFNCPEVLYNEVRLLKKGHYYDIECERLLPLYIIYASHIKPSSIKPIEEKVFISDCRVPVAVARTGWETEDLYFGIKGGKTSTAHGHMDVGSFVYDAYGVRWAYDLKRQEYAEVENPCKQMGDDFWNMEQESVRWKLFRFNCRQHNTLTVNDRDHDVNGNAVMLEQYASHERMGASFDLTPLFNGDLASAIREGSIRNGEFLEIIDRITGGAQEASVRWTLVSEGAPEITPDGIILSADGKRVLLKAEISAEALNSGQDIGPAYKVWTSDPAEAGCPTAFFDFPVAQHICGFEFKVGPGQKTEIKTTIKKI